ncbi:efflux RND transporter permease subunit [Aquirufa aurantiipilula]|uniref:Efflux RND transporter permease subunit n=1 Tax=Aquirufa aurantiipilula TaxID=2696561 RepID=A0ABT6BLV8_9BACT|nr:efflux RND transporter permease subunit [Aquirufa aurantiipilula]MDF5691461.1 efflux RND transporter permease subunit [Aquirufa aurantiipilula]
MQKSSFGIIILFIVLCIIGIAFIPRLSIQLNPIKNTGNLSITYEWRDVSPEILERQVSSKLEAAFSTLQGITKIRSISNYGSGFITIEIDKFTDLDELRFEVASLIRQVYPQLPKDVSYPIIHLNSPEEEEEKKPFMSLQLNGAANLSKLKDYAVDQFKPQLAQIEGIYALQVFGGNDKEWVLSYNRSQFENLNLTEYDIIQAISQQYKQASLGLAQNTNDQQMNVILNPSLLKKQKSSDEIISDLGNIPLAIKDTKQNHLGRIIHLSDILKIERKEKSVQEFYRINGENAVTMVIQADAGANQLSLAKIIKDKLNDLKRSLPPTYDIHIEYDATEYIQENLEKIWIQTGLALLILLLFVGISSRSGEYTLLILISLMVNLAISFIFFYFLKIEIHLYSMAAITTSLGIVIDNTIVMIDHYRRYENRNVFKSLSGATFTTLAGLSIIWFLPEENKMNLMDFALVMTIELGISLIVALFLVPALIEKLSIKKLRQVKQNRIKIKRISVLSSQYNSLVAFLLKFRKSSILVIILAFGTSIYLFSQYVFEYSHPTKNERTALYVNASLPNHSTVEQMNEVYLQIEKYLSEIPEIDRFITRVYDGQYGSMVIYFKTDYQNGPFPFILKNKLISLSSEMSGISWDIYGVGQGFSQNINENSTPTFLLEMRGYHFNELGKQANTLKRLLEVHPRIQEVNTNKSVTHWNNKNLFEYVLTTKSSKIAILGQHNNEIYEYLQRQNFRPQTDLFQFINGEFEEIKVIPTDYKIFDIWALMNQPIQIENKQMKLSNMGAFDKQKVSSEINKENQEYIQIVSFEYFGSQIFGEKFLDKTLAKFKSDLPLGFTVKKKNNLWQDIEKEKSYWLLGIVILLIYMICAIIFESLLQPLALISIIPISYIGVFLTFYFFDINFDQGGYASLVLLSGNVVCAAIFIITEFNNLQKKHSKQGSFILYLKAFNHKITPIFLTVVSTMIGLIPFIIFGQNEVFWFALGAGTIGGLLFSLLGIILYLPVFLPNMLPVRRANIK